MLVNQVRGGMFAVKGLRATTVCVVDPPGFEPGTNRL